ncbi:MAG: hypothetical protein RLZZ595_676 [Bacteroidota bacterium]|jgi:hypothetical protein
MLHTFGKIVVGVESIYEFACKFKSGFQHYINNVKKNLSLVPSEFQRIGNC